MDVLLIDDNERVLSSLAKILRQAGLEVRTAENGLAAFQAIGERPSSVIVCDIQMPFLNGARFYEELTHEYPEMAERVLFVTAWAGDRRVKSFLDEVGRPYLEKPFDFGEFVRVVRDVAREHEPGTP